MKPLVLAVAIALVGAAAAASPVAISRRSVDADTQSGFTRPHVAVASNGRTFVVAWDDVFMPAFYNGKVYYRTYSDDGAAEQAVPSLAMNDSFAPAVVWNGSEWVIAASFAFDPGTPGEPPSLRAARIAEHGGAIAEQVAVISSGIPPRLPTGIAANGGELMIGNGETVLTSPDLTSPRPFRFRVRPLAAAGGTFLTVDDKSNVAVVTRNGAVLSTFTVYSGEALAATANGSEYALVFTRPGSVEAMTVATDGTITSRRTLQTNADAAQPAVTFTGGVYLAAWALPNRLCTESFTLTSINAAQCEVRSSTPLSIAVAGGTSNALLAWSERITATRTDVVRTRFYSNAGTNISRQDAFATSASGTQRAPRIEKTAEGLAVRWTEPAGLMSATVMTRGDVRGVREIAPAGSSVSRIAHASAGTLTVWSQDGRVMARFQRDDDRFDPPFVLGDGRDPDVATDGDQWLVVWEKESQIASTIVTADRIVVSPGGTLLARSVSAQSHPAVASRGSDYLVAWSQQEAAAQLMAIGVSTSGNPNGGVLDLASTRLAIQQIQIAVSGRRYLIVAQNDLGFPATSLVPDIFVAGVPADQPFRVRGHDGGFALLEGSPIRIHFIDLLGNDQPGNVLPIAARSYDFLFDGPRLMLAYEQPDGYVSSTLFLETFAPRRRG